jgi:hypothetical protein
LDEFGRGLRAQGWVAAVVGESDVVDGAAVDAAGLARWKRALAPTSASPYREE